jgi:glycosyltransferase involved in cell wall biosynthesis
MNVPALNELVDNEVNGLLFKENDVTDLVRSLETIYARPSFAEELAVNGRKGLVNFSIECYSTQLKLLYEKIYRNLRIPV